MAGNHRAPLDDLLPVIVLQRSCRRPKRKWCGYATPARAPAYALVTAWIQIMRLRLLSMAQLGSSLGRPRIG
jgi:hypothetical protein